MTTPNDADRTAEDLDELHAEHDSKIPALELDPSADEPDGDEPVTADGAADEPASMAGDPDLQSGHLGE